MKKKHIFVLSILAVVIFVLGVYAAKAETVSIKVGSTTISFLPLVITTRAQEAPPGVLYVFSSTATTNGDPGGRSGMGAVCFSEDSDSHFCHMDEINSAWETGVFFSANFDKSWVDTLASGSWADGAVNCGGWNSDEASAKGSVITWGGGNDYEEFCDAPLHVTCCKHMP